MKHLGYIADADGILLWFPNQNRTFSVPKPYGFRTKNIRFWDGERKRGVLETDFYTFRQNIDSWLDKQTIELN